MTLQDVNAGPPALGYALAELACVPAATSRKFIDPAWRKDIRANAPTESQPSRQNSHA